MKSTTRDHPILLKPFSFSGHTHHLDQPLPTEQTFQKIKHFRKEDIVIKNDTRLMSYFGHEPQISPFNPGKPNTSNESSPNKPNSERKKKLHITLAKKDDGIDTRLIRSEYVPLNTADI